jgi:transposase
MGETPTVHVPAPEARALRELSNCRSQVIAKRTRAKNTLRALLRGAGVVPPRQPGLWTKKGLAWLRQLKLPTAPQELRRDLLLEEIETLIRQVRRIEQQLNRQAQRTPAVARLRSIPGVGVRTAKAVAAFVDDPHRFRHAKAVGRYFGLAPCQDQSGDRDRLGHITREGAPVVRRLVAEAAWQARRRSPTVRAYFERAQRGDPQRKKIALVATAHYLVRVLWALLQRGRLAGECGPGQVAPGREFTPAAQATRRALPPTTLSANAMTSPPSVAPCSDRGEAHNYLANASYRARANSSGHRVSAPQEVTPP